MARGFGTLTSLWIGFAVLTPTHVSAGAERQGTKLEETTDDRREPSESTGLGAAPDRHWQFGIALNALAYQRASFDVEPINSGRSFPGSLERLNFGPSGGSILLEPGFVLGNQLVLGLLLDIGSALNELEVKGLGFRVTQTAASFAVGPRVAYFFLPQSRFQPFLTAAFGYTTTPSEQAAQTLKITEYQGFAGAGLSYSPVSTFSFDTSVRAAYGIGYGYVDSPPLENAELSGSVMTFMWTIGTTGWLN